MLQWLQQLQWLQYLQQPALKLFFPSIEMLPFCLQLLLIATIAAENLTSTFGIRNITAGAGNITEVSAAAGMNDGAMFGTVCAVIFACLVLAVCFARNIGGRIARSCCYN